MRSVLRSAVGQPFEVRLDENPSTGYRWNLVRCQLADSREDRDFHDHGDRFEALSLPDEPSRAGAGGQRVLTFALREPGLHRLEFDLERDWQIGEIARTAEVFVDVAP